MGENWVGLQDEETKPLEGEGEETGKKKGTADGHITWECVENVTHSAERRISNKVEEHLFFRDRRGENNCS